MHTCDKTNNKHLKIFLKTSACVKADYLEEEVLMYYE